MSRPRTLKDIKVYQDIHNILSAYFPERFIAVVYDHMRENPYNSFDHEYLRNSLKVLDRLIDQTSGLEKTDCKLLYAIMSLTETGRPFTTEKPYELSPGISWLFLKIYAPEMFSHDELCFISRSCKPLMPQSLRPSPQVRLQLLVHNTRLLTNVVNFKYQELYDIFRGGVQQKERADKDLQEFLDYYGPQGNLWPAISGSAKRTFSYEVAKFKREVTTAVTRNR